MEGVFQRLVSEHLCADSLVEKLPILVQIFLKRLSMFNEILKNPLKQVQIILLLQMFYLFIFFF